MGASEERGSLLAGKERGGGDQSFRGTQSCSGAKPWDALNPECEGKNFHRAGEVNRKMEEKGWEGGSPGQPPGWEGLVCARTHLCVCRWAQVRTCVSECRRVQLHVFACMPASGCTFCDYIAVCGFVCVHTLGVSPKLPTKTNGRVFCLH